jgi:hypothetical protein
MTRVTRRWLATLALIAGVGVLPLQDATTQTMRRAPAVEVEHAQIYLIRGLFGVFSSGMDQMAAQLKAQGYSNVSLWSWTDVDQIAADIISGHQNGDNAHVILIGHSLGSNAVVQVADRIGAQGIPVDLAVTFDITEGLRVPLNVERFINFYQNNGFGRPALEPAGFTGEFSNINLSNQTQLDHGNIDNAPQLQQFVMQRIYEITHTHVRTVSAKRKTTRKG